ncbi:hypothetical protein GCM10010981_30620 [Dyella nitratireducens]|uniref:Uncharacterized protein n=2 Tax=Dyella nitratireducens TaxID=1849580 RepID=A0ABQ1G9A1_9GAMM|nr:hypothetical protein GCM10010981_30620 [Dyella nitratireducens]GLQ40419.1 hypothetical protein GCM10007902_02680 [Dyella nitratireducens]
MAGDLTRTAVHAYLHIFEMAGKIESDHAKLLDWFCEDNIVELGNQTAKCLVDAGQSQLLESFLISILAGTRG